MGKLRMLTDPTGIGPTQMMSVKVPKYHLPSGFNGLRECHVVRIHVRHVTMRRVKERNTRVLL